MPYLSLRSSMRFSTPALMDTSSIETGSSATITLGLMTSALATETLCLCPPLSSCGNLARYSLAGASPASSSACTTISTLSSKVSPMLWLRSGSIIVWRTVVLGLRDSYGSWKTICMLRLKILMSSPSSRAMSLPRKNT